MEKRRDFEAVSVAGEKSRVMPLLVAGVFCFFVAALLGFGSWRLFGTTARQSGDTARFFEKFGIASTKQEPAPEVSATPEIENPAVLKPEPKAAPSESTPEILGTVDVEGGETAIGGGVSQRPLRREFVKDFLIAETEVTNAEYLKFIKATNYRPPDNWNDGTYPKGTADYPVAFVSVSDANEFCKWKSKEIGLPVRLPTYAEWQRAAGGDKKFKYPWGNEWNEAAISSEKKKAAAPVKSFELNRSPYGAFDMVGNVWEWTAGTLKKDELVSKPVKSSYRQGSKIHLVLGGSFNEDRRKLVNSFWAEIDAGTRVKSVGFRYVIIPERN